jgi:hypothetical protein
MVVIVVKGTQSARVYSKFGYLEEHNSAIDTSLINAKTIGIFAANIPANILNPINHHTFKPIPIEQNGRTRVTDEINSIHFRPLRTLFTSHNLGCIRQLGSVGSVGFAITT